MDGDFFIFHFRFRFLQKKYIFVSSPRPPLQERNPHRPMAPTGRDGRPDPDRPCRPWLHVLVYPGGGGRAASSSRPPEGGSPPTGRKEGRRRRRRAATPPRLCARRLKQAAALFYFYPSLLICLPLLPSPHRSLLLLLISRESIRIAAIHPLRIYLASYCSLLHYPICRAGAMRYCC